jgi:hypothetical protein
VTLIVVGLVLLVALGGFDRPWLIVLVLLVAVAAGFVLTRAAGRH